MAHAPQTGTQAEQDSRTMRSLALTIGALCGLMVVLIVAARIITA